MGFLNNMMATAEKMRQNAAAEAERQRLDEIDRQKRLSADRAVAFAEAHRTSPLPISEQRVAVAGGLDLLNDEFVVSVAKEWGWSSQRLTLTTHRVLWSKGVVSTDQKSIYLTDIRDVRYKKPMLGVGSIILETAGGKSVEGLPAAANGPEIRDRLMTMIHWARQRSQRPTAASPTAAPVVAPDRFDQLRRLGELKAQGILSEEEFQAEKAKLLAQSS